MTTLKGYSEVFVSNDDRKTVTEFSKYMNTVDELFDRYEKKLKERNKITIGWIFKEDVDDVDFLEKEFKFILKELLQVPVSYFRFIRMSFNHDYQPTVCTKIIEKYQEAVPKLVTLFNSDKVYLSDSLYEVWLDIQEIEWTSAEDVSKLLTQRLEEAG